MDNGICANWKSILLHSSVPLQSIVTVPVMASKKRKVSSLTKGLRMESNSWRSQEQEHVEVLFHLKKLDTSDQRQSQRATQFSQNSITRARKTWPGYGKMFQWQREVTLINVVHGFWWFIWETKTFWFVELQVFLSFHSNFVHLYEVGSE